MTPVEQAEAECTAARRALRAEQAAPRVDGEPMYTWQTSEGPLTEPQRIADAVRRWIKARTAVVAARKAAGS